MAARQLFRRNMAPVAAGLLTASALMYPRASFAESPERESIMVVKKPIYDDPHAKPVEDGSQNSKPNPSSSKQPSDTTTSETAPKDASPTPTDRLATQIRRARLSLYKQSLNVEYTVNDYLTRALHLESSFTSTIASLAPPPTANEPLLPGFAYVLVSTLAGSILTRNRGLLLRFTVPLAFGLVAAETTLPVTMRNVGDLIWTWEKQYPELAKTHLQVRDRVERFWETGKAHAQTTKGIVVDKVDEAREGVEDWVKKGK